MRIKKFFISLVLGLGLTLALLWLLGGGLTVVRAASFTVDVPNDENDGSCAPGDCSLREAIIAANGNGQADTITLGSGTYALTLTGTGEDAAATGDLDITNPLTITGAGPSQTIIDASGLISDRVLDIQPGAGTVVISGVTIINGNTVGDWGGGIYNYNADLTLINTVIISNTASGYGGGVASNRGNVTLSGTQILSNTALRGGGVYVAYAPGTFTQTGDSIIAYNRASGGTGFDGGGGGVHIGTASVALEAGQVFSNTASGYGGGIFTSGGATLGGGQILSNTAGYGGGVYVYQGSVTLSAGQIRGNNARYGGGGIYHSNGTLTLVNTTISGNQATSTTPASTGGGLSVGGGTVVLTYTTVASNTAASGGRGIHRTGGTVLLQNTILAYNGTANCNTGLTSNDYNLDSGNTCGFSAIHDQPNTDPLLGPLADNGGDTLTHALSEGSPAIDNGTCVAGITTDQRGVTRPQGSTCDVGAYESGGGGGVYLPIIMRNN